MSEEQEIVVEKPIPSFGSLDWNEYAMSKFAPDEMFEGNPKVDGLWRVTEEILGEITDYSSKVVEAPSERNNYCATVEAQMTILRHGEGKRFLNTSGVGDCSPQNADKTYSRFPSSLAETRAKARALRTVLRLRNVVAAEELNAEEPDDTHEYVTENQTETLDLLCGKLDIGVIKLLFLVAGENSYTIKKFSTIHARIIAKCIKKLGEYQNNRKEIPVHLIGYVKEWKKIKETKEN